MKDDVIMRARIVVLAFVTVLVTLSLSVALEDSDATVPDADETVYFFTFDLTFFYDGGGFPTSVEWDAVGIDKDDGSEIDLRILGNPSTDNSWSMYLDRMEVSGCSEVYVTQTAIGTGLPSEKTTRCIILGDTSEQPFMVTFYDGYSGGVVYTKAFIPSDYVYEGDPFVTAPEVPERDDYDFIGWFYGPDLTQRFDPYAPVTGNMDVYAKWVYTGTSSGNVGSIQIGNHLVTFECSAGLTYTIEDRGSDHVSFSVSEAPGFEVDESSITAHANGTQIHPVDGIHTITDIDSDVHVVIVGDLISQEGGEDDGGIPLWVWILLIVIIILVVALVLWIRSRNARQ